MTWRTRSPTSCSRASAGGDHPRTRPRASRRSPAATTSRSCGSWQGRATGSTACASRCGAASGRLADLQEIDDEHERLAGLDVPARTAIAVAEPRWDGEPAAAADLHPRDALIPALDDPTRAELERERAAAIPGRVELLFGRPAHADVMDVDGL